MQKFLEKILFYGLILTLITPLIIGESLLFPFVSTKAYFFYIVVDLLLVAYLLSLSSGSLYPRKSKLLLGFFAINILGIIIDLFGISFTNSFWGNYERMMGGYNILHLLVYLWLLLSVFSSRAAYQKLFRFSTIVSFLVGIYGLLQKLQVHWSLIVQTTDSRLFASLGNAAYLAGFALIFLFITAYLFIKEKNIYWRIFYGLNFVLNFYILSGTATRGALVALAAAIVLMLFYILFIYKHKKIKFLAGGILLVMLLAGSAIFLFRDSAFVQGNLALKRISEISIDEVTVSSRLTLWQMSIEAAQEKPVFGYGQNNIRVPLDRHHDYSLTEDWFDSSHNKFFDELLAHGLVGLLLQVAFFLWLLWSVFKKRAQDFWGTMLTLGMLVAYVVQALFVFDSFIISWLFVFILGFIILNFDRKDGAQHLLLQKKLPVYIGGILSVALIVVFSYIYYLSISPATKIVQAEKIIEQQLKDNGFVQNLVEVDQLYKDADEQMFFNYDIFAPAIARISVDIFENSEYYNDVQIKRHLELVEKIYQQAIIDSGDYSKFYVNLSKMYQLISQESRLDYLDESIVLLKEAVERSPSRMDIYFTLARSYVFKGEVDSAIDILNQALNFGVRQRDIYMYLAEIESRQGNFLDAFAYIDQFNEYGDPISFLELEKFAKIFIERGEWQATADVFIKMVELQPESTDTYFNVALAYAKLGQRDQAIEWINKAAEIDPSLQNTIDEFINNL